jgi:hypothetical protein
MDANKTQVGFIRQLTKIAITSAIFTVLLPTTSLAQAVQAGPFVIDGTAPDSAQQPKFTDPVGSVKELGPLNASTTKLGNIHLAAPPMLDFTNPNSSTDLATIWLEAKRDIATNDIWLYFAWERETSSGSSVVSYEFQADPANEACDFSSIDQTEPASDEETTLINTCNPWANRKLDDFMIVWDFGGGSTDIILRTFGENGFDAGKNVSLDGNAFAALNAEHTIGEGAINLSETIFKDLNSCFNIANVIPGTVTGNSDQADYKDTVLADISSAVTISNCGTVNITKATDPEGESGDFSYTLTRSGDSPIDYNGTMVTGGTLHDHGGSDQVTVIPGPDYQLTENLEAEPFFALRSIFCSKPAPQTDGEIGFVVNAAETTDCIITNELLTGTITVIKNVINAYGGNAVSGDFCIDLNDDEITPAFAGSADGTLFTFIEGNKYSVEEIPYGQCATAPPGYEPTYSGECSGSIVARQDKTCTITNEQKAQDPASFTLFKQLITDNGGTALQSDWMLNATLKAGSPAVCTSQGVSGSDSGSGVSGSLSVSDNVAQCVYELSESDGPTLGYTASAWSCTGDVSLTANEITVGPNGGSCSITNDDDAPSLTLVKEVVNDNGGTEQAGAWTLTAGGYDTASPDAGTYDLSESGPGDYTLTSLSCDDDSGTSVASPSVTLGLGEDVTCTFVNDDDAPSLTLVKEVVNDNGGTEQAGAWTLTAGGYDTASPDASELHGIGLELRRWHTVWQHDQSRPWRLGELHHHE